MASCQRMILDDQIIDQMEQVQLEPQVTLGNIRGTRQQSPVVDAKPFNFLALPLELRMLVYQFFFRDLVLLYHVSPSHDHCNEPFSWTKPMDYCTEDALRRRHDITNLLCVNKDLYCETAPVLYKSARMVTGICGIFQLLARTRRLAQPESHFPLFSRIRVKPELLVSSLTIQAFCSICEAEANDESAREEEKLRKLKASVAVLEENFPRLEKLVLIVNRYSDIMGSGTVPKVVSPLCCLRRIKVVQIVAQHAEQGPLFNWPNLSDFLPPESGGGRSRSRTSASRLRMEDAVLKALGDIFSGRCHVLGKKHLHEDRRCIYGGSEGAKTFLKDILARVLKEKYHVKTQTLT